LAHVNPELPPLSAVMPVRNEERHLAEAVSRILAQDYPAEFELILAVGPSRDRTMAIARSLALDDPRVRVLENPTGKIPSALNIAVAAARFEVIARIDGHALLPPGYLSSAVRVLHETGAADVGGIMAASGETDFQKAVAWAMTSPVGVGSAQFHTGGGAGSALSVYLGVYRRSAVLTAGGWDEAMLVAEDWELNYRIRSAGELIWFDPSLRVTYRPRASVRALAIQYFRYGRWRRVVARQYPDTVSVRYLAPPVASLLFGLGLVLGVVGLFGLGWLTLGFILPGGYLLAILLAALVLPRGVSPGVRVRIPLVLATMHLCWGSGFLTSPKRLARATRAGLPSTRAAVPLPAPAPRP
jgi:glycosyltransferase involved in cell wall biosynthesis